MIARLFYVMAEVHSSFSKESMAALVDGSFEIELSDDCRATAKHLIRYPGKYLVLLVHGRIEPLLQQHSIVVAQGKVSASIELERELILFLQAYPDSVESALQN
jgi:hypothetical protein